MSAILDKLSPEDLAALGHVRGAMGVPAAEKYGAFVAARMAKTLAELTGHSTSPTWNGVPGRVASLNPSVVASVGDRANPSMHESYILANTDLAPSAIMSATDLRNPAVKTV